MTPSAQQDKVVLITGAAGGLGAGLVSKFASQGWAVVAGYHRRLPADFTGGVTTVQLDVTDAASVDQAARAVLERHGRIDVLVNNAGIIRDSLIARMADEQWDEVLAVGLKGAFLCSRAAIRPMLKQRDGHILNIASFSARFGTAGQANYAAAKAGLIGLTESLAREAGSRNVRANAILPGVLPTPMTANLDEERLAEMASLNTLGRLNDVAEVARFVVFLAAMENVSGQLFQLDSRIGRWA